MAHGEGKFIARDAAALARLEAAGQLALRYLPLPLGEGQGVRAMLPVAFGRGAGGEGSSAVGTPSSGLSSSTPAGASPFPDNPNGSMADVAGVCDATGRVWV